MAVSLVGKPTATSPSSPSESALRALEAKVARALVVPTALEKLAALERADDLLRAARQELRFEARRSVPKGATRVLVENRRIV